MGEDAGRRTIRFVGSGSRPAKYIDWRGARYPIEVPEKNRDGDAAGQDAACPFLRPGCPCGVPF